ncbi:MAG: non-heme iron oxygenase ferredoxin subunit [Pseudomonadota bacterium]
MTEPPENDWHLVGPCDDIDEEDVIRFELGERIFAVYNTVSGFYATDGICTHEVAELADGLVIDEIIECPLHQGRFHIPTGKAKSPPVCEDLKTYPVRVEDGQIYIKA